MLGATTEPGAELVAEPGAEGRPLDATPVPVAPELGAELEALLADSPTSRGGALQATRSKLTPHRLNAEP